MPSWNYFYFPEIFSQEKLRIHAIRRGDGKHFTAKTQVCSQVYQAQQGGVALGK